MPWPGPGTRSPGSASRSSGWTGCRNPGDRAPVTLDVSIFTPPAEPAAGSAGTGAGPRFPAVLLAHGFGGTKADLADEARRLAVEGYVAVMWTARGFGTSGGRIHLDALEFEVADARHVLDTVARRPDVVLDAPGDPRVGVTGGSYGGALALELAALDRRVDAIAPQITWHDLRQALFPQFAVSRAGTTSGRASSAAVTPSGPAGVFRKAWASVFFSPSGSSLGPSTTQDAVGAGGDVPAGVAARSVSGAHGPQPLTDPCGRFAAELCAMYLRAARTGRPDTAMLDRLWRSSPGRVASRIATPTLLVQGQADSLFPLSEGDANARAIAANGTPVKVVWEAGGHDGGIDESERLPGRACRAGARTPRVCRPSGCRSRAARRRCSRRPAGHRPRSPRYPASAAH